MVHKVSFICGMDIFCFLIDHVLKSATELVAMHSQNICSKELYVRACHAKVKYIRKISAVS